MNYQEINFDITAVDKRAYLVAHCIAADLSWGSGIAPVIIRNMYDAEKQCRYKCSTNPDGYVGDLKKGDIMPVDTPNGTFVNLITKTHSWDKPTYADLTMSLEKLKDYLVNTGRKVIVMPKIGCGLDRLEWSVVRRIIMGIFSETDIAVWIAIWH